jgi:hypothetical protein
VPGSAREYMETSITDLIETRSEYRLKSLKFRYWRKLRKEGEDHPSFRQNI